MCTEYVLKVFREWIEETIEHIHTNTKEGSYDRKYSEAPYLATIKFIDSTEEINKFIDSIEVINTIKEYLRASCAVYDTSLERNTLFPECLYSQAFELMYINFCTAIQESEDGEI